jgi:hypothetical protein
MWRKNLQAAPARLQTLSSALTQGSGFAFRLLTVGPALIDHDDGSQKNDGSNQREKHQCKNRLYNRVEGVALGEHIAARRQSGSGGAGAGWVNIGALSIAHSAEAVVGVGASAIHREEVAELLTENTDTRVVCGTGGALRECNAATIAGACIRRHPSIARVDAALGGSSRSEGGASGVLHVDGVLKYASVGRTRSHIQCVDPICRITPLGWATGAGLALSSRQNSLVSQQEQSSEQ